MFIYFGVVLMNTIPFDVALRVALGGDIHKSRNWQIDKTYTGRKKQQQQQRVAITIIDVRHWNSGQSNRQFTLSLSPSNANWNDVNWI